MDIYMYPFGNPGHPVVLRDVTYGDVSAYMAVTPGQYTVAMRGFGAPATSHPALITNFMVTAQTTYTVAASGRTQACEWRYCRTKWPCTRVTRSSGSSRHLSRKTG